MRPHSKASFIWKKSSRVELRVTHLSYQTWRTLYMTNKKFKGRLAGSPFFYCEVNLLAGPVLFANKPFFSPSSSNRSGRDNQSMRKHCWLGQRSQFFSQINAHWEQGGWPAPILANPLAICLPDSLFLPLLTYLDVSDPPYFHVNGPRSLLPWQDKKSGYLKLLLRV